MSVTQQSNMHNTQGGIKGRNLNPNQTRVQNKDGPNASQQLAVNFIGRASNLNATSSTN